MKSMKKALPVAAVAGLALAAVGCDFLGIKIEIQTYDVNGKVVAVQAAGGSTEWWTQGGQSLAGATITARHEDGATSTATVGSSGTYAFSKLKVGRYTIEGSSSGWTFVPRTVDVTGSDTTLPDLLAYYGADADTIYVVTEWRNPAVDIDSHLTVNDTNSETQDSIPEGNARHVYHGNATFGNGAVILDRDVLVADIAAGRPAVETVRIVSNPFQANVLGGFTDGFGWIKFYLNAYNAASGLTGALPTVKDARATVHVMQGDAWIGSFPLAVNTAEQTVGVLKMHVTYDGIDTSYTLYSIGGSGPGVYKSIAR